MILMNVAHGKMSLNAFIPADRDLFLKKFRLFVKLELSCATF